MNFFSPRNLLLGLVAILFALTNFNCNQSSLVRPRVVTRSIYFWKSVFRLSNFEKQRLAELNVNTIYVKFFDVDWNDQSRAAAPLAQIRIADAEYLRHKDVIPTVFITNECIFKIDSSQTAAVAQNILQLVKKMCIVNGLQKINELQIDCDWTSTTKETYFAILSNIRRDDPSLLVSATIRLHQVKFIEKTGVPPVTKGMLMCYNMGNLKVAATDNSIIEIAELKKYIGKLNEYPLPLDVALPVFEWNVLLRNGQFAGLMENLPAATFTTNSFVKANNRIEVKTDTTVNGYTLKKGDVIRNEKSEFTVLLAAAKLVGDKLPAQPLNVSLYHLDSLTLSKYSLYEMENIYNSLH